MSHFVAYILQFQEIIMYEIPPGGGREGSIASLRSSPLRSFFSVYAINFFNPFTSFVTFLFVLLRLNKL